MDARCTLLRPLSADPERVPEIIDATFKFDKNFLECQGRAHLGELVTGLEDGGEAADVVGLPGAERLGWWKVVTAAQQEISARGALKTSGQNIWREKVWSCGCPCM